ncbi:HAD family hydrolase [Nonomuraea muscovyensis]|uniref:Phosphoserine phosphatase n=1 Tax=Nonomuraea muscovyensis TaxID=1124761 RepID=A0A7X0EVQ6_9ACTN|nr:HAD family hydrolase [Nonomuraea muscovyensis]MBB6343519.1 phosphoserine phosphatase [Nonomuraea muscovyensis]
MIAGNLLPSWRPGASRDALLDFLDAARSVPRADRVAYFDNDGTLWCERPAYVQLEFFLSALRRRVADDPSTGERDEFTALLSGDRKRVGDFGLTRIALALADLFEGFAPEAFATEVRAFMATATHATLGRPMSATRYQPMLELIGELRRRDFTVGIVTGGGTEFVRAVSGDLYGVPPELVVGTLIAYDFGRDSSGRPGLRRTGRVLGGANEGPVKVTNIQTQLGRRPILAAGNSGGDREMLEWAVATDRPALALLVEHDDAEREFAYAGEAATLTESEPVTATAARAGWTVVSMAGDWETVFPRR